MNSSVPSFQQLERTTDAFHSSVSACENTKLLTYRTNSTLWKHPPHNHICKIFQPVSMLAFSLMLAFKLLTPADTNNLAPDSQQQLLLSAIFLFRLWWFVLPQSFDIKQISTISYALWCPPTKNVVRQPFNIWYSISTSPTTRHTVVQRNCASFD